MSYVGDKFAGWLRSAFLTKQQPRTGGPVNESATPTPTVGSILLASTNPIDYAPGTSARSA
jgi:hypothetical protein